MDRIDKEFTRIALRVSAFCIICNLFLCVLKLTGGFPAADLIASLIVCVFIAGTAHRVLREAVSQMVDKACDAETAEVKHIMIHVNPGEPEKKEADSQDDSKS